MSVRVVCVNLYFVCLSMGCVVKNRIIFQSGEIPTTPIIIRIIRGTHVYALSQCLNSYLMCLQTSAVGKLISHIGGTLRCCLATVNTTSSTSKPTVCGGGGGGEGGGL